MAPNKMRLFSKTPTLLNLWHRLRGRQRLLQPDTDPVCNILEQPIDIIILIIETMPMPDRLMLAQTCRALRTIVFEIPACLSNQRHVAGGSLQNLMTADEQLDYLFILTRDRIDSWVCDRCVAVHPVDLDSAEIGTKFTRWQTACPKALKGDAYILFDDAWENYLRLEVRHDHVQTALKCIRHWDIIDRDRREFLRVPDPVTNDCWVHPKVVNDPAFPAGSRRLKFVMKATGTCYHESGRDINLSTIPYLRACVHCLYEPVVCLLNLDSTMSGYQPLCEMAMDAWIRNDGTPTFGACSMCATDFAIHFTRRFPRKAVLQIWQDLGGEGSMTDRAWRARQEIPYRIKNQPSKRPSVRHHHEPGSVMRLYEEGQALVYTWNHPEEHTFDLLRLASQRRFHVADPLDERILSEEQHIYKMSIAGNVEGWSIHDI
ncbi:hypothetical protein SODALDRAFT_392107 [Sodiomyces alkalinus F11]|uniref:F-box domain-containing protein n=1 Tax=Sodiomyces alkalinus (strain CBS 110278 / VKM F-3762 / F11) TaxID=1314773 RepID=A0A3N2Q7W7_SODAK|nr:hypothetical protein SODALDRAFT_392107 [Sodiomyces alkalinus F11]ROT42758.1 hypothetical protein SODALDRAFT_392107 [Sodiomyces alkalinus F11]